MDLALYRRDDARARQTERDQGLPSSRNPGRYGDGLNLWLQVSEVERPDLQELGVSIHLADRDQSQERPGGRSSTPARARVRLHTVFTGRGPQTCIGHNPAAWCSTASIRLRPAGPTAQPNGWLQAKLVTFQQCADQYIAAHQSSLAQPQAPRTMAGDADAPTRTRSSAVCRWPPSTPPWSLKCWSRSGGTKTETAVTVAGSYRAAFSIGPRCAVIVRVRTRRAGVAISINCCRPRPRSTRWSIIPPCPYVELPAFMSELAIDRDGVAARALEFVILTAARTGEVNKEARWDEIDLLAKVWTSAGGTNEGRA